MYEYLKCDLDDAGIATVTLSRPPVNALNLDLMAELKAVAEDLTSDSTTRVVVLRSAVEGFFMAGADLSMLDQNWDQIVCIIRRFHEAGNAWQAIPVPTIAVLEGQALGAGCELALACDFRFASEAARIGCPEVRIGLIASGGGTQRLPRLIGRGPALEMLLRGRAVGAVEAARLGLVTESLAPGELSTRVAALAVELAALPTLALRETKRCVLEGMDAPLAVGLRLEERANTFLATTHDAREGADAFLHKRKPVFDGA